MKVDDDRNLISQADLDLEAFAYFAGVPIESLGVWRLRIGRVILRYLEGLCTKEIDRRADLEARTERHRGSIHSIN